MIFQRRQKALLWSRVKATCTTKSDNNEEHEHERNRSAIILNGKGKVNQHNVNDNVKPTCTQSLNAMYYIVLEEEVHNRNQKCPLKY